MDFYGQRLRIAREFRALTQSELARRVCASNAVISLCEAGKNNRPSHNMVKACGEVLGFEPTFFSAPIEDVFEGPECNFRHREELFVLRGAANCELARHCDQQERAIGIEIWHREYRDLPALKSAERFWVVINRSDEREANLRFLQSIADDALIRERALIATVNDPGWMSYLFQLVRKQQRFQNFSAEALECGFKFIPFPLPGNTEKMDALTEPPPPPEPTPVVANPFWWQR